MKVRHTVETNDSEVEALYSMVSGICLATYPSVEEQTAAVVAGKVAFKSALDELIAKAFKIGTKMGKKSSDTMDTAMYMEPTTMV